MASDFTASKDGFGAVYRDGETDSSFQDTEPLINPTQLRARHLLGIPLVSAIKDIFTGKPFIITDETLKEQIIEAVGLAELESGIDIFPKTYKERQPYIRQDMEHFGYIQLRHRPASSVQSLAVVSSDDVKVWDVPLAWVETGYLHQGTIHLLPFAVAAQSGITVPVVGPVGLGLLPGLFKFDVVPALWVVEYTTGFAGGKVPRVINQLIGTIAAMEILSMLAATYARVQSASLGIDGLSQSQSLPGALIFQERIKELADKRRWLIKKLQRSMGLGLILSDV